MPLYVLTLLLFFSFFFFLFSFGACRVKPILSGAAAAAARSTPTTLPAESVSRVVNALHAAFAPLALQRRNAATLRAHNRAHRRKAAKAKKGQSAEEPQGEGQRPAKRAKRKDPDGQKEMLESAASAQPQAAAQTAAAVSDEAQQSGSDGAAAAAAASSCHHPNLAIGVNAATRSVEQGVALAVIMCGSTQPPLLTQHLPVLCAARHVPLCALDNLSTLIGPRLRCKRLSALAITGKSTDGHPFADLLAVIREVVPQAANPSPVFSYQPLALKKVPLVPKALKRARRGQLTLPKPRPVQPPITPQPGKKKHKAGATGSAVAPAAISGAAVTSTPSSGKRRASQTGASVKTVTNPAATAGKADS